MKQETTNKKTVSETLNYYPLLLEKEYFEKGEIKVDTSIMDRIWENLEHDVADTPIHHSIFVFCPPSNIVVYSKPLDFILDKYNSIEEFWDYVLKACGTEYVCLVIHDDKDIPHIHLLMKFKEIIALREVACFLDEIYLDEYGIETVRDKTLKYLYINLYQAFHQIFSLGKPSDKEQYPILAKITPTLAEHILIQEYCWVYDSYKEYLDKEN